MGSEMCIRDSTCIFPVILQKTRLSVEVNYPMAVVTYLFEIMAVKKTFSYMRVFNLVPRGSDTFGQHQGTSGKPLG